MADPFEKLWEPLMLNPAIGAMGSWSVTFDPAPVPAWEFRLVATNVFEKRELARWFGAMELAITQAALRGPETLYALLYGAESDLTKSMRGKTWADYGVDDPRAKAREIIEGLKSIAGTP